jgi:YrbI family 3-deoxy-D-manno-octulosonate 8-phosphate phosphatase
MIFAFIPARGGSKGIPNKNIKPIAGKPLIQWVIEAAQDCELIQRVTVGSDSELIRKVARDCNAMAVDRSRRNASDTATSEEALLEYVKETRLDPDDILVFIQATSPLVTSDEIKRGIEAVLDGADSALSVVRQKRFIWKDGTPSYDLKDRPRRQEHDGFFVENGAFYITRVKSLKESGCRVSGNIVSIECSPESYYEIDEPEDWMIVENLLLNRKPKVDLSNIKLFITDVDGTLTDGCALVDADGNEQKKFNVRDGMAVGFLKDAGISVTFVTGSIEQCIKRRAEKLGLDSIFQGVKNKAALLDIVCKIFNVTPEEIAYIGDDTNDLEIMKLVGYSFCPQDSEPEVIQLVDCIIDRNGGQGAFRKAADIILSSRRS